ncbi:MAG: hypothetical protein U9Q07_08745 [Planctomycetota bacterium]|nr:hypothetical protein [Planctomycetota bacterium]
MGGLWTEPTARTSGISAQSVAAGANYLGSEIDNETNLDQFAAIELTMTPGVAPTAGKVVELYILYAIDGTNYEQGGTSDDPARGPDAVFPAEASTSAQATTKHVRLRPFKFKLLVKSELDQEATITVKLETFNPDFAS